MTLYVILRWVTAVEALVLIGWACAILQEATRFRPPNTYVRLVTASYIVLVVAAALHAIAYVNGEPHIFVLIRFLALTYGLGAMFFMWRYYRYEERVKRHNRRAEEAAKRLREEAGLDDD